MSNQSREKYVRSRVKSTFKVTFFLINQGLTSVTLFFRGGCAPARVWKAGRLGIKSERGMIYPKLLIYIDISDFITYFISYFNLLLSYFED